MVNYMYVMWGVQNIVGLSVYTLWGDGKLYVQ